MSFDQIVKPSKNQTIKILNCAQHHKKTDKIRQLKQNSKTKTTKAKQVKQKQLKQNN